MNRLSPPGEPTRPDTRLKLLALLTALVGALALLQRSSLAPLPQGTTDFMGGIAVGLAVSLVIGWLVARD